jgi:hypothetical protein
VQLEDVRSGHDLVAALRYYDSLAPVAVEEMLGVWQGTGIDTGHPLDGLLERFGWYGKRFESPDDVHPLVFNRGRRSRTGRRRTVTVNPALLPMAFMMAHPTLPRLPGTARIFPVVRTLLATRKPRARLRMTEYRGVVTATMCYDALPINDAFRRVDDVTVMGAMDMRGMAQPFLFVLQRPTDAGPTR